MFFSNPKYLAKLYLKSTVFQTNVYAKLEI